MLPSFFISLGPCSCILITSLVNDLDSLFIIAMHTSNILYSNNNKCDRYEVHHKTLTYAEASRKRASASLKLMTFQIALRYCSVKVSGPVDTTIRTLLTSGFTFLYCTIRYFSSNDKKLKIFNALGGRRPARQKVSQKWRHIQAEHVHVPKCQHR